jgi:hypothetical protein
MGNETGAMPEPPVQDIRCALVMSLEYPVQQYYAPSDHSSHPAMPSIGTAPLALDQPLAIASTSQYQPSLESVHRGDEFKPQEGEKRRPSGEACLKWYVPSSLRAERC